MNGSIYLSIYLSIYHCNKAPNLRNLLWTRISSRYVTFKSLGKQQINTKRKCQDRMQGNGKNIDTNSHFYRFS